MATVFLHRGRVTDDQSPLRGEITKTDPLKSALYADTCFEALPARPGVQIFRSLFKMRHRDR